MPKESKKPLSMGAQRHAEYYGMQQTFDALYAKSKAGEIFDSLMAQILEENNIMLKSLHQKNTDTDLNQYAERTFQSPMAKQDHLEFLVFGTG